MPRKHKNRKQKITELKLYIIIKIINVNEMNLMKEKYSN